MWEKALDTPLRLDVYYQYYTDATQPEQTKRKELLERWCIDYQPSEQNLYQMHQSVKSSTISKVSSNPSNNVDETIAQLHQVCKHLVVLLRTLYTRIKHSYRLHRVTNQKRRDNKPIEQQQQQQHPTRMS